MSSPNLATLFGGRAGMTWILFISVFFLISLNRCIRLPADSYTETPKARNERTAAGDTGKLFESQQVKGSIVT